MLLRHEGFLRLCRARELLRESREPSPSIADLARAEAVDLVVIGPEAPLVAGLADELRGRGVVTFVLQPTVR